METLKKLFTLAFVMLMGQYICAQGIVNSKHDFSANTWANNEICIVCHTPHHADITVAEAPLWNHELSIAVYDLYSSPTMDATDLGQPTANSKLCLSCHDGTVALENFGGTTGPGANYIGGSALIGIDLRDDHPISFTYDDALATADGGLWAPTTTTSGVGGGTITEDMLFNEQVQCASCHDVHDTAGNDFLLVKDNLSSALCLTCHDK